MSTLQSVDSLAPASSFINLVSQATSSRRTIDTVGRCKVPATGTPHYFLSPTGDEYIARVAKKMGYTAHTPNDKEELHLVEVVNGRQIVKVVLRYKRNEGYVWGQVDQVNKPFFEALETSLPQGLSATLSCTVLNLVFANNKDEYLQVLKIFLESHNLVIEEEAGEGMISVMVRSKPTNPALQNRKSPIRFLLYTTNTPAKLVVSGNRAVRANFFKFFMKFLEQRLTGAPPLQHESEPPPASSESLPGAYNISVPGASSSSTVTPFSPPPSSSPPFTLAPASLPLSSPSSFLLSSSSPPPTPPPPPSSLLQTSLATSFPPPPPFLPSHHAFPLSPPHSSSFSHSVHPLPYSPPYPYQQPSLTRPPHHAPLLHHHQRGFANALQSSHVQPLPHQGFANDVLAYLITGCAAPLKFVCLGEMKDDQIRYIASNAMNFPLFLPSMPLEGPNSLPEEWRVGYLRSVGPNALCLAMPSNAVVIENTWNVYLGTTLESGLTPPPVTPAEMAKLYPLSRTRRPLAVPTLSLPPHRSSPVTPAPETEMDLRQLLPPQTSTPFPREPAMGPPMDPLPVQSPPHSLSRASSIASCLSVASSEEPYQEVSMQEVIWEVAANTVKTKSRQSKKNKKKLDGQGTNEEREAQLKEQTTAIAGAIAHELHSFAANMNGTTPNKFHIPGKVEKRWITSHKAKIAADIFSILQRKNPTYLVCDRDQTTIIQSFLYRAGNFTKDIGSPAGLASTPTSTSSRSAPASLFSPSPGKKKSPSKRQHSASRAADWSQPSPPPSPNHEAPSHSRRALVYSSDPPPRPPLTPGKYPSSHSEHRSSPHRRHILGVERTSRSRPLGSPPGPPPGPPPLSVSPPSPHHHSPPRTSRSQAKDHHSPRPFERRRHSLAEDSEPSQGSRWSSSRSRDHHSNEFRPQRLQAPPPLKLENQHPHRSDPPRHPITYLPAITSQREGDWMMRNDQAERGHDREGRSLSPRREQDRHKPHSRSPSRHSSSRPARSSSHRSSRNQPRGTTRARRHSDRSQKSSRGDRSPTRVKPRPRAGHPDLQSRGRRSDRSSSEESDDDPDSAQSKAYKSLSPPPPREKVSALARDSVSNEMASEKSSRARPQRTPKIPERQVAANSHIENPDSSVADTPFRKQQVQILTKHFGFDPFENKMMDVYSRTTYELMGSTRSATIGDHGAYLRCEKSTVPRYIMDSSEVVNKWYDHIYDRNKSVKGYVQKMNVDSRNPPKKLPYFDLRNRKGGYADYPPGMILYQPDEILLHPQGEKLDRALLLPARNSRVSMGQLAKTDFGEDADKAWAPSVQHRHIRKAPRKRRREQPYN